MQLLGWDAAWEFADLEFSRYELGDFTTRLKTIASEVWRIREEEMKKVGAGNG